MIYEQKARGKYPSKEKLSNNMKGGLPKRPTLTLEQKEPSINKYSVEEQTIMRQSTIDQLELQRRDEILSEIEVRKAGYV